MSICATYPSPPLNPLCRAFNLEALITNAKLGAQLGVDYYNFPSKYGRTIQDAVNFAMNVKPGKEDVEELLPHVAAVAAAYGDPRGVYARWIAAHDGQGGLQAEKAPYWFYDQAGAVGVRKARREVVVGPLASIRRSTRSWDGSCVLGG